MDNYRTSIKINNNLKTKQKQFMKKLILILTIILTSLISFAQYGGCEFTTQPDSSCIEIGTYPLGNPNDTVSMVCASSLYGPRKSNWRVMTELFQVRSLIHTTSYSNKYAIAVIDTTTKLGLVKSFKAAKVAFTGDYNDLSNKPSTGGISNITSIASGARNFNQAYQVSTSKYTDVRLSAQLSCVLSLTGGTASQIFLEYSVNGSTGWTFAGEITGSNIGTLTIGLNTTQVSGSQVSVILPPSYYWRLRTNNTTGTATYTFLGGLEITY